MVLGFYLGKLYELSSLETYVKWQKGFVLYMDPKISYGKISAIKFSDIGNDKTDLLDEDHKGFTDDNMLLTVVKCKTS